MKGLICPLCSGDSFNHLHSSYKSEVFECKKCYFMCEFLSSRIACFYFAYENVIYYTTMQPDLNSELAIVKPDNNNIINGNDLYEVGKFQYKSTVSFADIKELHKISISYVKNIVFK